MHGAELADIRVHECRAIGHDKLYMVMFANLWTSGMITVFSLHPQVGDYGMLLQLQD